MFISIIYKYIYIYHITTIYLRKSCMYFRAELLEDGFFSLWQDQCLHFLHLIISIHVSGVDPRPKNNCLFVVTCLKKSGSVGRDSFKKEFRSQYIRREQFKKSISCSKNTKQVSQIPPKNPKSPQKD